MRGQTPFVIWQDLRDTPTLVLEQSAVSVSFRCSLDVVDTVQRRAGSGYRDLRLDVVTWKSSPGQRHLDVHNRTGYWITFLTSVNGINVTWTSAVGLDIGLPPSPLQQRHRDVTSDVTLCLVAQCTVPVQHVTPS